MQKYHIKKLKPPLKKEQSEDNRKLSRIEVDRS